MPSSTVLPDKPLTQPQPDQPRRTAMTDTRKISRRSFGRMAAGLAAGTAGAAALPGLSRTARAQGKKAVTFLLDVKPSSKHALFFAALDHGYFAKRGLDLTFN